MIQVVIENLESENRDMIKKQQAEDVLTEVYDISSFSDLFESTGTVSQTIDNTPDNIEKNLRIANINREIMDVFDSIDALHKKFNKHYRKMWAGSALLLVGALIWSIIASSTTPLILGLFSVMFFIVSFRGFMGTYVQNVVYEKDTESLYLTFKRLVRQLVEENVEGKIVGNFDFDDEDLNDGKKWRKVKISKSNQQEDYMIRIYMNDQGMLDVESTKVVEDS